MPLPLIAGGLLLVLILGGGGFFVWKNLLGAKSGEADPHMTILRLAGSNTIGEELGPALAAAFLKEQGATSIEIISGAKPEEKFVKGVLPGDSAPSFITIAAHGSATAFTALAEKTCDIGMASRQIKPDEATKLALIGDMLSPASEHVVGLDGIAVIVSPSNLVDKLDKDQIRGIFTGEITDWSKVTTFHGAIKIYARNDNSGTYDTFKTLVLAGKPLAQGAQRIEDSKALSEAVAVDPYGVGFIGLPYVLSSKAIAVSDKGIPPLLPTRLTVSTEDYLLSRRLYFYTPANPANRYTRMFIEFVISKRGQDVVGNIGFATQNVAQISETAPDDAPQEYKQLTRGANRLSLDFRFQSGQTTLDSKGKADLDRVVSMIADENASGEKVMLFGFSDNADDADVSQAQSLTRAKAVEAELVQRGLKPTTVRGFGSKLPVAGNDTEDGRDRNRRVEIWIKK
ncbi:MAG: phosphate ABC transporter substrate-binding/OmpA family protein [Terracidiphilus sp.]|jgi:phosphate transport system substrate-binding protein